MRYPEFLEEGGRIGCIAPSFGCAREPYASLFSRALETFGSAGYRTVCGPNVRAELGVGKSNSPEACGREINEFFLEDRCDVIVSCGGGETMCEDLPFTDFPAIAQAKPRWFMGYSDNTNLVFTLPTLCDTAAIYGPGVSAFGRLPWDACTEDAFALLTGKKTAVRNYGFFEKPGAEETDPLVPTPCTEADCRSQYVGRESCSGELRFGGRLLGGCLDILLILCGTPYDRVRAFNEKYREDGTLWFLEACDLNPMSIRRGLWQLRQAGWFDTATGFLIGRPLHFSEDYMGVDRIGAVLDVLGDMGLPILLDLDIGHVHPRMPLIAGAVGKVVSSPEAFRMEQLLK